MLSRFQRLANKSFVKSNQPLNGLFLSKQYSSLNSNVQEYQPGKVFEGFIVKENRDIKALGLTGVVLEHQKSGAQLLHLSKEDDSNNVFSIGFPTLNNTSDGVAHILEHTTLCGSKKYPVRDPFFKMMPRSLATYMNAWTANDFTQYPFSTQNPTDYYNLMGVYLDSVFQPILSEYDFSQEGWRIEKNPETNEWEFKGIVFNEMKGVFSDHGAVYYYDHHKHLYEGSVYNEVSGGHPLNIPELSWERLRKFHHDCYHPNNAKIFTFGNFPLDRHLIELDQKLSQTLSNSPKPSPLPNYPINPNWNAPRKVVVKGPFDPMLSPDQQHKISVSWLTNQITDTFTTMSLSLLFTLLTNTSGAPLQKALLDTHLGTEYSPTTGYNSQSPTTSFSIGVQGVNPTNLEKVEQTIYETLEKVAKEGFSKDLIEGALLNIELSFRHRGSNFGIRLVQGIMNNWNYGLDPLDPLEIDKHLAKLRSEISKGDFFESLIKKYLLENPKKLVYIAEPSTEFEQQVQEQESLMLQEIVKEKVQSEKDELNIQEFNSELQRRQMSKEDLSCLPTLTIDDIQKDPKWYPISSSNNTNVPITFRDTNTNGISYLKVKQTLPNDIPSYLRPFVPLLCECLTFLGCHDKSMAELDEEILLSTGGISFSPFVNNSLSNLDGYVQGITFSSHALNDKSSEMYRLIAKLILETNLDQPDRIKTLILNSASSLNGSVADSGHNYARGFATGILSQSARITDIYSGLYQARFMTYLANNVDLMLSQIIQHLKTLHQLLINPNTLKAFVVSEQSIHSQHETLFAKLQNQLVSNTSPLTVDVPVSLESVDIKPSELNVFAYPFSSYYSSRALSTVPFEDPTSPHYQLLSTLLTHLYLHREIREKGGAYGGGAAVDATRGTLAFYSYRDPNPFHNCEQVYKESLEWGLNHQFEARELNEAKLSVFQSIDHPLSASQEGLSEWSMGITLDMARARRHAFLSTTEAELKSVAEKLLTSSYPKGASVVIGQADSEVVNKGWNLIQPINA